MHRPFGQWKTSLAIVKEKLSDFSKNRFLLQMFVMAAIEKAASEAI